MVDELVEVDGVVHHVQMFVVTGNFFGNRSSRSASSARIRLQCHACGSVDGAGSVNGGTRGLPARDRAGLEAACTVAHHFRAAPRACQPG